MYQLLISDLDGTIFNKAGQISQTDIVSIHKLVEKGFRFTFASGRVIDACFDLIDKLHVNAPCICFDGALVFEPQTKDVIYENPLKKDFVDELISYVHRNNVYLELFSKSTFYAERHNWSDEIHEKFFNSYPHVVRFADIVENEQFMKAELLSHTEEEEAAVMKLQAEFKGKCRFSLATSPTFPGVHFWNILDNESSKGVALHKTAEYLNIPISDVIAVGDGYNDLPMLKEAGLAVAMGNAYQDIKDVAGYITDSVENNGISKLIEKFFINNV